MNTADRSVGHIDYAIKRRFAFVDVLPSDQAIDDVVKEPSLNLKAKGLYKKVAELFNEKSDKPIYLQSDFKAKDVQLGHSYFLVETEKQLELKLEFEIKPLLNEYVKDGVLGEETLQEIESLRI
ncbi:5-methylcytosine-specific restriction enzyme B [compost metagenome]